MAPKVFLTGATGYIGGDVFYVVANAHPDWQIAVLVRSDEAAKKVKEQYPNVRIVKGDLDSADIIEEEVKNADIVYRQPTPPDMANCDHVGAARAIAKGMSHHTAERPGWWIHTSGTGILTWQDHREKSYGDCKGKNQYDDWDNIDKVTSLPEDAVHRDVDIIVLDASAKSPDACKTAIVAPPMIYGPGRGPVNQRSYQVYELAKAILKLKKGIQVGKGDNVWHQVHVRDLSEVFRMLGEAAAAGGGKATWNDKGYYFAENGKFRWGDICTSLTNLAYEARYLDSKEVEQVSYDDVEKYQKWAGYAWGTTSLGKAIRARELFGWVPSHPDIFTLLPSILEGEAKALGL
ncbi:hypothetical protein KEM56_003734 [Ascosphaera pollenicola]|nr:hypothetical protein KEM56_003734 [Ascosphaera pollenicola]